MAAVFGEGNGEVDSNPNSTRCIGRFSWDTKVQVGGESENDARLDSDIVNCMTEARWLAIKRYFKLNNNFEEGKRGTPSYNPCTKFDYIFRCLIHNMNYCTASADLDQTIDESTWGFAGYSAEAGGRLKNKPVKKGKL